MYGVQLKITIVNTCNLRTKLETVPVSRSARYVRHPQSTGAMDRTPRRRPNQKISQLQSLCGW